MSRAQPPAAVDPAGEQADVPAGDEPTTVDPAEVETDAPDVEEIDLDDDDLDADEADETAADLTDEPIAEAPDEAPEDLDEDDAADDEITEPKAGDGDGGNAWLARARRIPIELPILFALAALTRFAFLYHPHVVVFDEVYFREFALHYKEHTFYYDVHPPLGKLLLALWGAIAGVDATALGKDPAVALRILPAFAGTLLIVVVYVLIRQLSNSRRMAALGAGFLMFDNALLVESRLTLIDSMLLLFGISAITAMLAARKRTGRAYWWWLAASAALAGCSVTTKVIGLNAVGLIGVIWLADLFLKRTEWRLQWKRWVAQGAVLALIPAAAYVGTFAVHFALLNKTGKAGSGAIYDAYMPAEFQATLKGNPQYSPTAHRSFVAKFKDLNKAMQQGQLSLATGTHPYSSKWWSWPIMKRGVYLYLGPGGNGKSSYIYTLGNPIVWWGTLLGAFVVLGGWIWKRERFAPYKWGLALLALGWLVNYVPFALIHRPMFLYHYFFGLIFSISFVAVGLGALTGWAKEGVKPWTFDSRGAAIGYWSLLGVAMLGFLYFAPISYGLPLSPEQLDHRMWLHSWR